MIVFFLVSNRPFHYFKIARILKNMVMRKTWFMTRAERDPVFHVDALRALQEATKNFTLQWEGKGARPTQSDYEKCLNKHKLKRGHVSDTGSGGRTWACLMRTFDYVYLDEQGYLKLTKVGEALLAGRKIKENISKQILTFQIPNSYSLEKNSGQGYVSGFKIRPVRFLLHLVNQKNLGYKLTKTEITFFAMEAKTDSELSSVTDEILNFRKMNVSDQNSLKAKIAEEFDHRERSDKGARDFSKAHGDVAHNFMLLAEYLGVVTYIRGTASCDGYLFVAENQKSQISDTLERFDKRYPFNTRYLISRERLAQNNGLDIDSYKASAYGSISPATNKSKLEEKISQLIASKPGVDLTDRETIRSILASEIPESKLDGAVDYVCKADYKVLSDDFIEKYLNETDFAQYENETNTILKMFGLTTYLRPNPFHSSSAHIELAVVDADGRFGVIDCKDYSEEFRLSPAFSNLMAGDYVPNYDGLDGHSVHFFGYIVSNQAKGQLNLQKITNLLKIRFPDRKPIQGFMINSKTLLGLLDYLLDKDIEKSDRSRAFTKLAVNQTYLTIDRVLRDLGYSSNS
jgi:hypothetical protein